MLKILKYSFFDLVRSRWSYVYFLFYLLLSSVLLFLNNNISNAIITLLNVVIVLVPLIGTIFGVMYYYDSQEFTQLLLAQPIKRKSIFMGQFLGVATSLSLSVLLGLGIPFALYGLFQSNVIFDFLILIVVAVFLSFIFSALAFNIALSNTNKIKGFGYAILLWLFLAVIYDGAFLIALIYFQEYPLDKFTLIATLFNPIDLSRILILLKLDISALLGYTGAIFRDFFGTLFGSLVSFGVLVIWVVLPLWRMVRQAKRKDF